MKKDTTRLLAGLCLLLGFAGLASRAETILGRADFRNTVRPGSPVYSFGPGANIPNATGQDNLSPPGRTNVDLQFITLAAGTYEVTGFRYAAGNTSGTVQPFLTERLAAGQHRVIWVGSANAPTSVGINEAATPSGPAARFTLASTMNVYAGFVMTQNAVLNAAGSATDHHGGTFSLSTNFTFSVSNPNLARIYAFSVAVQPFPSAPSQHWAIGGTAGGSVGPVTIGSRPNDGTHFFRRMQIGASVAGDIPTDPSTTFAFGAPIIPLPSLGADLTKAPMISTDTAGKAFYSPAHDKVYGINPGFVTITWKDATDQPLAPVRYLVTSLPVTTPKRLYHTHSSALALSSAAPDLNTPTVSVAAVNQTIFHWNTSIPDNGSDAYLRRHGDNLLRAKDRQGLIVVEHRDSGGNTVANGVQVVEVLLPQPDPGIETVAMGEVLTPTFTNTVDGAAFVASGQLYVHTKVGDSFRHKMIVTQSHTDNTNIDVYWRQTDALGIHWPFEFRRYDVDGLALEPVAIYHTESTLAPVVALPTSGVFLDIHYNQNIQASHLVKAVPNVLRAQTGIGEVVVIYFAGSDTTGNYLNHEIVQLRPYVPDVTAGSFLMGDELAPFDQHALHVTNATVVARGRLTTRIDANNFIYQHDDEDENAPFNGRVFAVKPTASPLGIQTEVFWQRQGLHSIWPYEMRRYAISWPADGQRFVRRGVGEELPKVEIPADLNPFLMPAQEFPNVSQFGELVGTVFHTEGSGWSLLGFETGPTTARDWVGFKPIRSVLRTDPLYTSPAVTTNWVIGVEITDPDHEGPKSGIVYEPSGDRYEPAIYQAKDSLGWTTGQLFAVNTGNLEVFWSNEMAPRPDAQQHKIQWPSRITTYVNNWPASAPLAVIASTMGTGTITNQHWYLYFQNNSAQPGYNPNDEHALVGALAPGEAIFPLRNDLGTPGTSLPFLVVPYQDEEDGPFGVHVWEVRAETPEFPLAYGNFIAGLLIQPPWPLSSLPNATPPGTAGVSGPFFQDRKGSFWARAAGNNGGPATIVMRFFYEVQSGFAFPGAGPHPAVGTPIPWLDNYAQSSGQGTPAGTPKNIAYTFVWPENPVALRIGESLFNSKFGLPNISAQSSVQILYQQATANNAAKKSVQLIDPVRKREVTLAAPPPDLEAVPDGSLLSFTQFPPHLRNRLRYNPLSQKLELLGLFVAGAGINEPQGYLLLNTLSVRDRDTVKALSTDAPFRAAVDAMAALPLIEVQPSDTDVEKFAITAGNASGEGFVTIAFNNNATLSGAASAISLEIIKVECPPYVGDIRVIESDNPFDEQLTLRHTGDFAGRADDYEFEWRTLPPDPITSAPQTDIPFGSWNAFLLPPNPAASGALDITIKGAGLFTLIDNWFVCRYRPKTQPICSPSSNPNDWWSDWTEPQLSEGWIKRVLAGINPFEQRVTDQVNTIVSMISQAGKRWTGNAPLNAAAANDFGLIEIYETVLKRGIGLSIEGAPPVANNPDVANALLLAAGRIADLYMLLGNEAYADAADPTIALAGQTTIHAFMNQTASLLEEELGLLRGRDASQLPDIRTPPLHHRFIWNFTTGLDDGQVAYVNNYNAFSLEDAQAAYPQGHGDAWGHYLTAIKSYYRLFRNKNFAWTPRTENVLVAGVPVSVDFFDERKFARAGAALAKTGAEIANLTYRQFYSEDPTQQWQGYEDSDTDRAWGHSEWARRAGQGAFLNWAVGNALLPSEDTVNTGIRKIDRTTVLDLHEIASNYEDIQRSLDEADAGLNPLGLAKNVVPFDISPTGIDAGDTHFEQIYDRAVRALNNAIVVFDYAQGSSVALREQNESLVDFNNTVADQQIDFRNRLIEVFGTPYPGDIGAGRTYPAGYTGPDIYNYGYVDMASIAGIAPPPTANFPVTFTNLIANADGSLSQEVKTVNFNMAQNRFMLVKPASFGSEATSPRSSPGEIQRTLSDLLQANLNFQRALDEYNRHLELIEGQAEILSVQYEVNAAEIRISEEKDASVKSLQEEIKYQRELQVGLTRAANLAWGIAQGVAEALPKVVGLSVDATSIARGAILVVGAGAKMGMEIAADVATVKELDFQHQRENLFFGDKTPELTNLQRPGIAIEQERLRQLLREQTGRIFELYSMNEAVQQASSDYLSALARGLRIMEDQKRFNQQTAAQVREYRYKDMGFRVFRNDALQKYRAQFNLAARYVYLAAKAYDYETNLQPENNRMARNILKDIVRARSLGAVSGGIPQLGSTFGDPGLADPMRRMSDNFDVLKGQLGFNNPHATLTRLSLRREHFRIAQTGPASNKLWADNLRRHVVADIQTLPEYRRFSIPIAGPQATEPGIVLSFPSSIIPGQNTFTRSLAAQDNSFNDTFNAIKIREVGIEFIGYNNTLLASFPRAYLIPAGADVIRSPVLERTTREWKILDQILPLPHPTLNTTSVSQTNYTPITGSMDGNFANIRRFPSIDAFYTGSTVNPLTSNSMHIGRSVWNTNWVLIIPGVNLLANRQEGIEKFIQGSSTNPNTPNGVSDIQVVFRTYSYSGIIN